jgi:hypothetical protein
MSGDTDRVKGALKAFIESLTARYRYSARYQCKVVSQNGDGTLELIPDDRKIPGMSGVPIYCGIPGAAVKVSPGARCLLEFAGGDPSKPCVTGWEPGSAAQIDLSTTGLLNVNAGGAAAVRPVARATIDSAGPWPIVGGNQSFKA